jgi:hypothetical protein
VCLSRMLGDIVFRLKKFVKKTGTNEWRCLFSYCLLPIVHPLATCVNTVKTTGRRTFLNICLLLVVVVSSFLVLSLLTGTTLEWCDKNNKDQRSSFALLPILVCVCYHMKSKQKRKEICMLN